MWILNLTQHLLLNADTGARFFVEIHKPKKNATKDIINIWYLASEATTPLLFDTFEDSNNVRDAGADYLKKIFSELTTDVADALERIADVLEYLAYEDPNVGRSGLSQLVGEIRGD